MLQMPMINNRLLHNDKNGAQNGIGAQPLFTVAEFASTELENDTSRASAENFCCSVASAVVQVRLTHNPSGERCVEIDP